MNKLGFSSVVHVAGGVNGCWQLTDLYFESFLNIIKYFLVFLALDESNCKTLGTESSGSAYSVQITVWFAWHVEVEYDVDFFNVNTTAKDLSSNKDTVLKLLESLVDFNSSKIKGFITYLSS